MVLFVSHTEPSVITEYAFHLMGWRDDHYDPMGTAFLIAPDLLLTAKHVIDDYWEKLDGRAIGEGGHGEFFCTAFQELVTGRFERYDVRKVWSPNSYWMDLAIMALDRPVAFSDSKAPSGLTINAIPPPIGSQVFAFGYHNGIATIGEDEIAISRIASTTIGIVKEIHPQGRDRLLSWPCFEVNARFEGGMSGGPVFNQQGEVCGLICRGMKFEDPTTEPLSYATMIWPMLAITLDHPRPGLPPGPYPALELARHGIITAQNWEGVSLQLDEQGKGTAAFVGEL